MSSEIYVIGASMTPFGKFMDRSIKSLVAEAVSRGRELDRSAGTALRAIQQLVRLPVEVRF